MSNLKLFMAIIGCTPTGRLTEQHDVFFGIGTALHELVADMNDFWKAAQGKFHIDAWREIRHVDGYTIEVKEKKDAAGTNTPRLFFLNLGGYKENAFEEYHYKIVTAAQNKAEAVRNAKQTAFYKHYGFKGAASHIDDTYGIDVDDLHEIADILPVRIKEKYSIQLIPAEQEAMDALHIGYLKIDKLRQAGV